MERIEAKRKNDFLIHLIRKKTIAIQLILKLTSKFKTYLIQNIYFASKVKGSFASFFLNLGI